jgi:hypothetical protein
MLHTVRYACSIGIIVMASMSSIVWRSAHAQGIGERSPLEMSDSQPQPEPVDEQRGIHAGEFRLLPSATLSLAYDSNVLAAPAPRDEEGLAIAEAGLRLVNEPGLLNFDGAAFARGRRFSDSRDQDTNEYGVGTSLREQWSSQTEFTANLLFEHRFESRVDVETPDSRPVSLFNRWQGRLGYAHTFNRLTVSSTFDGQRVEYASASESYRDIATGLGEVDIAYDCRNGVSLTASGYHAEDDYRHETPQVASASTNGALLGIRLNVTDFVEGELAGGYFRRTFDRIPGATSGLSIRSNVLWKPTRLTTLRLGVTRDDEPTRITGAFAKVHTDASLAVEHSYSRSIGVFVRGHVLLDDFDSIHRHDRTYQANAGVSRRLSGHFVIEAEYDYAARSTQVVDESFVRNVVSLSIRGGY